MTQKRTVIFLQSEDLSHADWILLDETGQITQTVSNGNLQELSDSAKESDIYVIAPGQDVLLTNTILPKLNRQRLRQALPFALEEQLIDDVSHLHFAMGDYQTDGTIPVAVIAKEKMQQWVDMLKDANISPIALIPAMLALPFSETQWQACSYNNMYLVRTGKYSGFATDSENIDQLLELKLDESAPKFTDNKEIASTVQWHDKTILEKSAAIIQELPFINLLQDSFPAKRKTTRTKNVWKIAGFVAAIWLGVAFFGNIISFFILHHQISNIDSEINRIYTKNFPNATSIVAPRQRLETKLKEITTATQKNNLLSLLATVGKSLSQSTGIRLQNLDYRNGQLTLEISSAAFENLDALSADLTQQGLSVKQQNGATAGSQVKATFIISAGAT